MRWRSCPGSRASTRSSRPSSRRARWICCTGLQEFLTEVTGMAATSLATLAGAHGELGRRPDDAGLPPGAGRFGTHQDGHTRQRPRHQPGVGGHGRFRRGDDPLRRRRQHRPGGPARNRRRRPGRRDDHAAQHPGPVRQPTSWRCARWCTSAAAWCTATAPT